MELSYLIHHLISSLELKQSLDQSFLKRFRHKGLSSTSNSNSKRKEKRLSGGRDATLDQTLMITEREEEEVEEVESEVIAQFGQPVYEKAVVSQLQVVFLLFEQLPDFAFLCSLCSPSDLSVAATERRNQLKMNLLSLLTSSYLVSSHAYFTQQQLTNPLSSETVFAALTASNKQTPHKPPPHPREEDSECFQLQQTISVDDDRIALTVNYDISDLLDGSVFFSALEEL